MPFDPESLGMGGVGGIITSIFVLLGWKKRIDDLEKQKQDKSVCEIRHLAVEVIDKKVDYLINRIDKVFDKVINTK